MTNFNRKPLKFCQTILMSCLLGLTLTVDAPAQDANTPGQASEKTKQPPIRVIHFKYIKAADALKLFKQLNGVSDEEIENAAGLALDERTNSIILMMPDPDDQQDAEELEAIFKALDIDVPAPAIDFAPPLSARNTPQNASGFSFSIGFDANNSTKTLHKRYDELEQQAHQLAERLRESKLPSEIERSELQAAVRKSFDARQALQRAELADLVRRMQGMQQSIDMRDKLSDKIIERRVEDLLNPSLKWEAPVNAYNRSKTISKSSSENSVQAIKQRVQGSWIVESLAAEAKDGLVDQKSPLVLNISGDTLSIPEFANHSWDMQWQGLSESNRNDQPVYEVDFMVDPNGDRITAPGILSYDGELLRICFCTSNFDSLVNDAFRPDRFMPGSKVYLFKCRRAPPAAPKLQSLLMLTAQHHWRHKRQLRLRKNLNLRQSLRRLASNGMTYCVCSRNRAPHW